MALKIMNNENKVKAFAKKQLLEEKKGIAEYEKMIKIASGDAKKMLEDILDDEKDHLEDLQELISGKMDEGAENETEEE